MRTKVKMINSCTQDWDKMKGSDRLKFCEVCEKNVFDFTTSSKEEILRKLNRENELCGRIKLSQIEEINSSTSNRRFPTSKWIYTLGLGSLLGITEPAIAQNTTSEIEIVEPTNSKRNTTLHSQERKVITGVVTDETGLPLPGVVVLVKDTNMQTQGDFDGKFSLTLPAEMDIKNVILIFQYIDFVEQEINISIQTNFLNVTMVHDSEYLKEVITTGGICRKRNVFHKIGSFVSKIFGGDSCH